MASLLVSFPNVLPRGLALGVFDFDNGSFRWVDLADVGEQVSGVTGLAKHGDRYYCLAQMPSYNGASALLMMDRDLRLREVYALTETGDAHSLLPIEHGFLANDTKKNRLIRIDLPNDDQPPRELEYWRHSDECSDVFHVNSTACLNGEVFVSMFDRKPEAGWEHSRDGKIVNISRNRVVCTDLAHPHSLSNVDGVLYWLESYRGLIHRFSDARGHEVVGKLEGYLRGLTYDEQYLYVGGSALRRRSKGGGTANMSGSLTPENANSWIYRLDRRSLALERRRLTAFSFEIYDLLLLEDREPLAATCLVGARSFPGSMPLRIADPRIPAGHPVPAQIADYDTPAVARHALPLPITSPSEEADPFVERVWRFEESYLEALSALEYSLSATRDVAEQEASRLRNTVESQAHHLEELTTRIEDLSGEVATLLAELSSSEDEKRVLQQQLAGQKKLEGELVVRKSELALCKAEAALLESRLAMKDAHIREYTRTREQHIADLQSALDRILYSRPGRVYRWMRRLCSIS